MRKFTAACGSRRLYSRFTWGFQVAEFVYPADKTRWSLVHNRAIVIDGSSAGIFDVTAQIGPVTP